jgi:hypothetical protein
LVAVSEVPDVISTRKLVVMALGVSALLAACSSDPTLPPPPKAPPQIKTSLTYTDTRDSNGQQTGLPSNDVYAMLAVSNGEFWIATNAGLARYANLNANTHAPDKIVNEVNGLPHPQVRGMAELDGKVYVATWGGGLGVYDIAGDAWTQVRPGTTGLTEGYISGLATSPTEDKLYLSTNNCVYIYAPTTNTWTHFITVDDDVLNPPLGQQPNLDAQRWQATISCVAVTEDAGIVQRWYGPRVETRVDNPELYGILVSKSASSEYRYTTENSGLVERNVNAIYYDSDTQRYWVGYVTKGVSQVDVTAKTWTNYSIVQGLPSNTVYSITRASDGAGGTTLWVATQGGLAKLDKGGKSWQGYGHSGGLPADRVRVVYSDDGHRLWAGFVDSGAAKISP